MVHFEDNSDKVKSELELKVARALEIIGGKCEGYAKGLAPVDTGNLRNSISHSVVEAERAVYVGTNVEYAPYQEYGTVKMASHPFLRPSAENHADEYKQIVQAELGGS